MIALDTAQPLARAVESISARTPIGSVLRSADWARLPQALRESAFFISTIESARFLEHARERILQVLKLERSKLADGTMGAFFDRSKFIDEMRKLAIELGLAPTDPELHGTIQDVTSERRLEMIFDIQTQRAQAFAKWKMEQDANVLDAYPAQELIRVEDREVPRGFRRAKGGLLVSDPSKSWTTRWVENGGKLIDSRRMVALKTDPIWARISRFKTPWPPFDFNSGMGLVDMKRSEAVRLGLLGETERLKPQEADFTDHLQASARGLSEKSRAALDTIFGDQVEISGDVVKWKGGKS